MIFHYRYRMLAYHIMVQNVFSIILNNLPQLYVYSASNISRLWPLCHRISSVLLSRFLLDLREHHAHPSNVASQDGITLTALKFSGSTRDTQPTSSCNTSPNGPMTPTIVRDFDDPEGVVFTSDQDFSDIGWSDEMECKWTGLWGEDQNQRWARGWR